jgi:MerR family transcriptional regulator, light-induced transcriptional regulator
MIETMLEETRRLAPVPQQAGMEYAAKEDVLVESVNMALEAHPSLDSLIGKNQKEMMHDNHRNHARFMSNVFLLNNFELLARTVPWVYRSYHARGFSYDYFPVELGAWQEAVRRHMSPESSRGISAVYDWLIAWHEEMIALSRKEQNSPISSVGRWKEMCRELLASLLRGDAQSALKLASNSILAKEDVAEFYLKVVQPCMYEVGFLWEKGEISVAHEHLATSIVGRIMAGLYPRFFMTEPSKGRAVVTSAPNELHEVGARMVADLLELDGWDTDYLGANTPVKDLLRLLSSKHYDLLALSVAVPFNIDKAEGAVHAVRNDLRLKGVRIMVGGRTFNEYLDMWQRIGADGCAPDAAAAVVLASTWWKENR